MIKSIYHGNKSSNINIKTNRKILDGPCTIREFEVLNDMCFLF